MFVTSRVTKNGDFEVKIFLIITARRPYNHYSVKVLKVQACVWFVIRQINFRQFQHQSALNYFEFQWYASQQRESATYIKFIHRHVRRNLPR